MNADTWIERYQGIAESNRRRLAACGRFLAELDRRGIEAFPVKGLDLLLRGYPALGLRPMLDADILLRRADVGAAAAALGSLGFRRQRSAFLLSESFAEECLVFTSADDRMCLDVSWSPWYLDSDGPLWDRAALRQTLLGPRRLLHPEDALLYLVAYSVAHRGRLTPLFVQDLEVLTKREGNQIDWRRWCAQARQAGMGPAVHHGLRYAAGKGADFIPAEVFGLLRPRALSERFLSWFYSRTVTERARPAISYLFRWMGTPGVRKKIKLLSRSFFLPAPYLELRRGREPALRRMLLRGVKPFWILVRALYFLPRDLFRLCVPESGNRDKSAEGEI